VKTHQRALYCKLGVEDRHAASPGQASLACSNPPSDTRFYPGRSHLVAVTSNPAVITRVNRHYG
jgi:hypothetical protein